MAYAKQGQEGKTRLEILQDTVKDFGHFLYNKDGEDGLVRVMGRTGTSWAKITVFFLIFYGCLAGFFAAMLNIFLTTVPEREGGPKMTNYLAGKQGLIPTPVEVKSGGYDEYVNRINDLLKPYKAISEEKYQNCTEEKREKNTKPCALGLTTLGECYSGAEGFKYGYDDGKPCIFFKMNRVYGWSPDPNDGKDYVELSCKFEKGDSKENLHIFPSDKPGFPSSFYPYFGESDWLAPIAALKVNTTDAGVVLCEALAKNIELSKTYRLNRGATGKVRVEIKQ